MAIAFGAEQRVPGTQAAWAHETLRRAIVTGELRAGDRLLQADLAQQLNISVTPVREALQRLEQEGLVRSEPHRGTRVMGLDLDRVEQIYAMRKVVEPLQIRRTFGQATEEDLAKATQLADVMEVTRDVIEFNLLNEHFHALTMVYDDSPTARTVRMLAGAAAPYVSFSLRLRPEQIRESNVNHYEQVEAVRAGNLEEFIELELDHLESTIAILRELGNQL
ncbi:MAG TPA: GntR family transcriptional regulator [Actinomycetales bacterium]|nr:GntR family transcriptional regulator [Actinomycetales bacterium]